MNENRNSRNKYIADQFSDLLKTSVLNIGGGGKKHLQSYLPASTDYTELDIAGTPDIIINLEKECPMPIADNAYETVVCTEVLEHLDNFHEVFAELLRVSSKWVIISLPNCLSDIRTYWKPNGAYPGNKAGITRGSFLKFYGLPAEIPEDRHKWFFTYSEARAFMEYHSKEKYFQIEQMFPTGLITNSRKENFKRFLHKLVIPKRVYLDLYSSNFWCVLRVGN